jgi:hypothetical protein
LRNVSVDLLFLVVEVLVAHLLHCDTTLLEALELRVCGLLGVRGVVGEE